jgi:hypothetical protein
MRLDGEQKLARERCDIITRWTAVEDIEMGSDQDRQTATASRSNSATT